MLSGKKGSANKDDVTGLFTREYFDTFVATEWKRTVRHHHPVTIVRVDIDHFEKLGRREKEAALKKTAALLKSACRDEDTIARFNTQEFIVLLPETDDVGARHVTKRIQEAFSDSSEMKNVTIRIGVASHPRCPVATLEELIKLAEVALAHAKEAKSHAVVYDPALMQDHTRLFK